MIDFLDKLIEIYSPKTIPASKEIVLFLEMPEEEGSTSYIPYIYVISKKSFPV